MKHNAPLVKYATLRAALGAIVLDAKLNGCHSEGIERWIEEAQKRYHKDVHTDA